VKNENGSFNLTYHFKESGKKKEVVAWKNVYPGTLVLRPLHGMPRQASIFPGNLEHGIMFIGADDEGNPLAISHPFGLGALSSQIHGKKPDKIKFVQVTNDIELMNRAVQAAKYLLRKRPSFNMSNPALPFDETNRIGDPGGEFPYYYGTMYCFMALVKAYELAGYDTSNINEYELNYIKFLEQT